MVAAVQLAPVAYIVYIEGIFAFTLIILNLKVFKCTFDARECGVLVESHLRASKSSIHRTFKCIDIIVMDYMISNRLSTDLYVKVL